jgi:selenoprotein W-related protein
MKIEIQYCVRCGYETEAKELQRTLHDHFGNQLSEVVIVPGPGGAFEILVNGEKIYSKMETWEFPNTPLLLEQIADRVNHAST